MLVVVALIVILAAVLNLYTFLESSSTTGPVQVTSSNSNLQTVQKQIDDLYKDEEQDFLNDDLNEEQVEAIRAEIDNLNESTLDKNELNRQLGEVKFRLEAQAAVNAFYPEDTPAIKGDQVAKDLAFKEDLTLETVEATKEKYYFVPEEAQVEEQAESEEDEEASEPQLDAFQVAVNDHIDFAVDNFVHYDTAKKALADVEAIEIEDGQIGLIAQAMNQFEEAFEKVSIPAYREELEAARNAYVERFISRIQELTTTIPQYYALALAAVEPSEVLTQALLDNEATLNVVEESSEESSEEIVAPEPEDEWSWTPPESTWTPPVETPEPPVESEPEPPVETDPKPPVETDPKPPVESEPETSTPAGNTEGE